MEFNKYTYSFEFYVIPTIKVTYDKLLYGYYIVAFRWGKWELEINWK